MLTVHYFAAARAVAGVASEQVKAPTTLGQLIDQLAKDHNGTTDAGMSMKEVLERCNFLIDGAGNTQADSPLQGATRIDVLPPFAGG
ncbi:MoaD/ThiS family protein [Corynebacterium macginleyi]|uniref:MoaD/ThiS family protein n=1 Tax=Corynebacterium macginleyi TaxID=38290 RepID=A0A3M0GLY5_9CORY|nr:MoaD/ThiS family protein [Corynebacterium macginleyi]MBK4139920.1 MoaD/ThiS family protein [Corynebacterium macginleyi]MBK4143699.1 MoaD/ThiS family protein [Corynebacterium macginleyi]MBK4156291.1 MoaD/ThiS family protein [Corynebacterium macginleyi]MBK4162891.1 MoaD/ThiS family protein [Corynebacterium macginleyi]MBK4165425.1 MoaD/ThiS family protein [Corynebacterium macginleyi]